jgi:hypothetical protein
MQDWAETELAWDLAAVLGPRLAEDSRAELYAAIGAGNAYTAIVTLLQTIAGETSALSRPLVDRLGDWLDAYRYSVDAPRLRNLLGGPAASRSDGSEHDSQP